MLKQIIILLIASLIFILGFSYFHQAITWLVSAHNWLSQHLNEIFSGGEAGRIVKNLITLLAIPFFVALIPTAIYALVTRKWFPYFMEIVWVTWFVLATALLK